jgi:DnaJ-class molecular chaperone
MTTDPYTVLGVSRSASDEDIRQAFRGLAKKLHPDVNPDDKAAAERFKQVSQAYDLLGDPAKRRRFDAGEIDASGEPRHTYAGGFHGRAGPGGGAGRSPADDLGFGDIFSDLFGGRGPRGFGAGGAPGGGFGGAHFSSKGADVRYTLQVDFTEAAKGTRKRVTLPGGNALDLNVPAGVDDGRILRLKGKGQPGVNGGPPGDALVEITVRPDRNFERDGKNIRSELPISIDEAVLGGKVAVETIWGAVNLTIPKGTSSGQTFRLRGKGVKDDAGGMTGDQLVSVKIVLPDEIDEELAYFLTEWRQKHSYNPRR